MCTFRLAIVGSGKQSAKHVDALRRADVPVQPTFIDLNPELAQARQASHGGSWARSLEEVLDSCDAVDVCTPTPSHYAVIKQALGAGKHVFCEKPLSATLAEARELADLQAQANVVGMVGYLYRFSRPFQTLRRLLHAPDGQEPALGDLGIAILRIGGRGSHQVWKHMRDSGGGARNEMMVHMLDLATWCFGRPHDLRLLSERLVRPERVIGGVNVRVDAEDICIARMTAANGGEVVIQADLLSPSFSQYVEVQGTNGSFLGSIQGEVPGYMKLTRPGAGFEEGKTPVDARDDDPFARQMLAFVQAIQGEEPLGFASFEDSVWLAQALETMQ